MIVKKKLIPIPKLLKKTEKVFNAYIRERDSDEDWFTCIACGFFHPKNMMDAGHYVPVKSGSALRFNEWNVHGECKKCNGFDQFHLVGYRRRLILKIGEDAVKYLEDHRWDEKKWSREELNALIEKYKP